MQKGGDFLVGEHDFSSYRALGCQAKSPVRTVHYLQLSRDGERVQLNIGANAFLHHMVRNIAGVLMAIGRGDQPPQWAKDVLLLKDRRCGGVTAPPEGLYLSAVDYPQHFAIPPNAPGELI
jgi:tRNA pseudouridine38-40 synthase